MVHGRLYRFECRSCDAEYIAVGAEDDAEAIAMATANNWAGEDDLWYCPDCKWDGDDEEDPAPDLARIADELDRWADGVKDIKQARRVLRDYAAVIRKRC